MICPFCNFKRTNIHTNPVWECPNCKKAYNKNSPKIKYNFKKNRNSDEKSNITLIDIFIFPIGLFLFFTSYKNINTVHFGHMDMLCLIIGFLFALPTLIKICSRSSSGDAGSGSYGGDGGGCGGDGGGGE